jgi:hypothetical protein
MPNKRDIVKGEKEDLLHSLGHAMGRGKVRTQPIVSRLQYTHKNFCFK